MSKKTGENAPEMEALAMVEEKAVKKEVSDLPGVGPAVAAKLKDAHYDSLESIAMAHPIELTEVAGLGDGTAYKIINAARDALEMGFETGVKVLEKRKLVQKISTGSKELDSLLGGGVETQAITECYGKFSSGKSQLAFQLCVNAQKPVEQGGLGGSVMFIDTENSLPYDEVVFVKKNGVYSIEKIGELVEKSLSAGNANKIGETLSTADNPLNIEAISFDPQDYKVKAFPVTGFMKHPKNKIFKVRLTSGREVRTTQFHNFFTLNSSGDLIPTYLRDLKKGDFVPVPSTIPQAQQPTAFEDPEFMGAYVADGSVIPDDRYGTGRYLTIVTASEKKSVEPIVKAFAQKNGLNVHRNKFDLRIYSKELTERVKACYIDSQKYDAHRKTIPTDLFNATNETKLAFLKGYLAGDGSFDSITNTQNADTVSKELASRLLYLLSSLGVPARAQLIHRKGDEKIGPSECYNIHWIPNKLKDANLECLPNNNSQIGILLKKAREEQGLTQEQISIGKTVAPISQIETGLRNKIGRKTISRILEKFQEETESVSKLRKLVESDLWFDEIASIEYIGEENTYDFEVQPNGRMIENFLAGTGGVFVHNTFRPERIQQIARASGLDPEKVLENIQVARSYNSDHQMLLVEKADNMIKEKNIKLIIIDSLMSAFRSDYMGRGTLAPRQQNLNKHLHSLQRLADIHNIAVYLTNQVMDRPDIMFGDPTAPVGGNIVAHQATYRVYLRRSKETRRIAKLVDSPSLPDGECIFTVTENGIGDVEE
ncbi:DNA repair and recombination protein RadA [Candidatus Micrarchaeota archaeon]|nr:DNA repair and recombination protein RadA [Candidatus Micrarchaeota archaeon]